MHSETWSVYIDYWNESYLPEYISRFPEDCRRKIYDLGYNAVASCIEESLPLGHTLYINTDRYYRLTFHWGTEDNVPNIEILLNRTIQSLKTVFGYKRYEIRFVSGGKQ